MIPNPRSQSPVVSAQNWALLALMAVVTCFFSGCATTSGTSSYSSTAYMPTHANLDHVKVKVSLNSQMVYVEEDGRMLMVTPTTVGKAGFPTHTGNFSVIAKNATKRSNTYGYWKNASGEAHPGKASASPGPGWTYVGYPLAFWIEFEPGYGFHEGPVWPVPPSHGCLHIHEAASAKLFQLVKIGTPVEIRNSFPEDSTYGAKAKRPTDYADPDPAPALMMSPGFFTKTRDTVLLPSTPAAN